MASTQRSARRAEPASGRPADDAPARSDAAIRAPGRQRNTRQAAAIESALGGADGFRTAHDLFATIRSGGERIGLTTVYRHLALLADTGRADMVHTADGEAQYRLCGPRSDATTGGDGHHHHRHLVCRQCGRSVEVSGPEVEAWADRVAAQAGYTAISHTVELFGLCPEHSAKPAGSGAAARGRRTTRH
jgi:Fur family ferric uptake transcriptional regulator